MKINIIVFGMLILSLGIVSSCSVKQNVQEPIVDKDVKIVEDAFKTQQTPNKQPNISEDNYNKCFSIENGYDDFIYTNNLTTKTEKGNFFKKRSISDSKFVWSCGRGNIEKIIDTVACTKVVESFIDWETDEFIGLNKPCGSYCWTNIIIPLKTNKPIIYLSYSAIDFDKMNVVSIVGNYFLITNLRTQKEVKFPIDQIECIDNFSLFSLHDIKLKGNLITFSIKCKDGSILDKKTEISLIKLLD